MKRNIARLLTEPDCGNIRLVTAVRTHVGHQLSIVDPGLVSIHYRSQAGESNAPRGLALSDETAKPSPQSLGMPMSAPVAGETEDCCRSQSGIVPRQRGTGLEGSH